MGTARTRPSHRAQRRRVVASVVQSAAAAALGLVISLGAIRALGDAAYARVVDPQSAPRATPLLIAVLVAAVALLPRWAGVRWLIGERCGWPVASAGALVAATTAVVSEGRQLSGAAATVTTAALAAAGALALGGVLLAAAEATGLLRLAIGCGLAAGLVSAPLAFAAGLGVLGVEAAAVPGVVLFGLVAVISVAAIVADRLDPRIDLEQLPRTSLGRALGPIVIAVLVGLLPAAAEVLRRKVAAKLTGSGASERRTELADLATRLAPLAVAVVAAVVLVWYARRRAGTPLVRWALTGLGLGALAPLGLQVDLLSFTTTGLALVVVAGVAALAGVLLARKAPRALPWDAVGLLVALGGLVLLGRSVRTAVHSPGALQSALLIAGMAMALAAALTPLLRPEASEEPGTRTPAEAVGTLAVGVAALAVGAVALGPAALTYITYKRDGSWVLAGPGSVAAIVAVLLVIFVAARIFERLLASMPARAALPVPTAPPPANSLPAAGATAPLSPPAPVTGPPLHTDTSWDDEPNPYELPEAPITRGDPPPAWPPPVAAGDIDDEETTYMLPAARREDR